MDKIHLVAVALLSAAVFPAGLLAQPAPSSSMAGLELPVVMRRNVTAGKTPAGSKVEATLSVATLISGVVVPQDATLSGEVTESVAKSETSPSRLAIHMDSVRWKNRSVPISVYLTAWYYPRLDSNTNSGDMPDDPMSAAHSTIHGSSPGSLADHRRDPDSSSSVPGSDISKHRVPMKNVESARNNDTKGGGVTLTSTHSNIKLDTATTYVLASGPMAGGPG